MSALLLVAAAVAVEPQPHAATITTEQIIITGERVKRSLQDTPSSVAVATSQDIEAAAADRVDDVLALIPNVQLGSGSDGPAIRGQDTTGVLHDLPAFLGGNRPRTTLVVDGRAVTYNEFAYGAAPLWDVERIEVFRSPQTTTQGRNSIAGAIFVETADPKWSWEGRGRLIAGNWDTRQASAVISGPVIVDQLALRVSGDRRHERTKTRIGRNANGGPDPNDDDYAQARLKLLATPAALPGGRVELIYAHTRAHAPQVEGAEAPFRKRRDPGAFYGIFRTKVDSLTARVRYDPSGTFGVSGVVSGGDAHTRRFAPRGFGETRIHSRDVSGELVARWRPSGRADVLAGASVLRTDLDQRIDVSATPFGLGTFDDVQKSFGIFGQATIAAAPRLKLTTGLRYQYDRQDRDGQLLGRAGLIPLSFHKSFQAWLPKLSVEFALSEQVSGGLLVQRAYNPGGTSLNLRRGEEDRFKAETLWDYEMFARATIPKLGISIAVNAFHYDMYDAQRPQEREVREPGAPAPVTFLEIDNAPRAFTQGLEAQVRWRANGQLSIEGGLGLLRTKVTDTIEPDDPLLGKSFQRSPAVSAALAIDWRPARRLGLSAQVRHNSSFFSDDSETRILKVEGWTSADARAAWDFGRFELFAYARNLTNEFHVALRSDERSAVLGPPRQVGVGLDARF